MHVIKKYRLLRAALKKNETMFFLLGILMEFPMWNPARKLYGDG